MYLIRDPATSKSITFLLDDKDLDTYLKNNSFVLKGKNTSSENDVPISLPQGDFLPYAYARRPNVTSTENVGATTYIFEGVPKYVQILKSTCKNGDDNL